MNPRKQAVATAIRAAETAPEDADAETIAGIAHGALKDDTDPGVLWTEIDAYGGGGGA